MIEYFNLYLPKTKREVKIEVSIPRNYQRLNTKFDTMYLLDGQNAFKDSHAAFNRSIRASKHMGFVAGATGKRIIGIAVYNAGNEMGRINEYTPFKITNAAEAEWTVKQDLSVCNKFCEDFIEVIIPYIDNKYPTIKDAAHRYIYGSSLAGLTAIYLAYNYPNTFGAIGAYSTASFLCPTEFYQFVEKRIDPRIKLFLYVGRRETSDGSYDETLYFDASKSLYDIATKHFARVRMVVSDSGTHCEACWDKNLIDFFSFIYSDNIIYKY